MIGVIAMPKKHTLSQSNLKSANHYVKWIESSGAKAMIIPYNISLPVLLKILKKINGIVFVGGAIENKKIYTDEQYTTYVNTVYHAYKTIKEYNDQGRYFPIWSTCLGFEMLLLFDQNKSLAHLFDSMKHHEKNGTSTLTIQPSRIHSFFPPYVIQEMKLRPCVTHHHIFGFDIIPNPHYSIVSTEDDFINMIEFKKYPFYGSQFHPERHFDTFSKQVSVLLSCFFYSECLAKKMN